jgi:glycosyltransferase involved in cell wall biosynthesis
MAELKIVVLGMMGRAPFGGHVWLFLNWLRALDRLGHEVWYVEDDTAWPYDPVQNTVTDDCSYAVEHIDAWMRSIGLAGRWAFRLADRQGAAWGLEAAALDRLYRNCDLLLNLEGGTILREEHLAAPCRVYVETDPVIAELELAADPDARDPFVNHHVIATYGENFGAADCKVPLDGRRYVKTRQAIDLDLWPAAGEPERGLFTTVGNYRQEGEDREYQGEVYFWSKHVEWEKFLALPKLTGQAFELAVGASDEDRARLAAHGWTVVEPLPMSLDILGAYPDYIRGSRAEFTVAKDMNVRLRSGWFSERDACYLASGKPVVAQDTGFSNVLPTGAGLFGFTDLDSARAAVEEINADYRLHARAAREVAQEHFEASGVARRLLADLGLAP